jgi:hypothetical protein
MTTASAFFAAFATVAFLVAGLVVAAVPCAIGFAAVMHANRHGKLSRIIPDCC